MEQRFILRAIDYGTGRQAAEHRAAGITAHSHDPELLSRGVQGNLGLGMGVILFGLAMGGLFRGRLRARRARHAPERATSHARARWA